MGLRSRRIDITEGSRPVLARHAKLKFDEARKVWVILVPERVLAPDEIAVEILQLCDGVRSVDQPEESASVVHEPAAQERVRRSLRLRFHLPSRRR